MAYINRKFKHSGEQEQKTVNILVQFSQNLSLHLSWTSFKDSQSFQDSLYIEGYRHPLLSFKHLVYNEPAYIYIYLEEHRAS